MFSTCFLAWISLVLITEPVAYSQHVAVTGVQTGIAQDGARPYRRDIRDLAKDVPAWSLYIQSIKALQKDPEDNLISYYQLASIHGRPYIGWDNFTQGPGAPSAGYCIHGSPLFLTWHRPYLALFEQALIAKARHIAKKYPPALVKNYTAAADTLRLPYWDWAADARMPDFVSSPSVVITPYVGKSQHVRNPLTTFIYQKTRRKDLFPSSDGFLATTNQTARSPDNAGGASNPDRANKQLTNSNFKEQTYRAFMKSSNIAQFSDTLQIIHGGIHVGIGGSWGHMTYIPYSAFDPIFYLLHTNVDRITALYQAMYPNQFIEPGTSGTGTFAQKSGPFDASTPLSPFSRNTRGDLFTSLTCRELKTFGYAYKELPDWKRSTAQLQALATSAVLNLYGSEKKKALLPSRIYDAEEPILEWSAAICVDKYSLNGKSFIIRLFLVSVPADPTEWAITPSLVSSFVVNPPPMEAGRMASDRITNYDMDLDKSLSDQGYDGQDRAATAAFLASHLNWRVQALNGTVVPNERLRGLKIRITEDHVASGRLVSSMLNINDTLVHAVASESSSNGVIA